MGSLAENAMTSFFNTKRVKAYLEKNYEYADEFEEGMSYIVSGVPAVSFEDCASLSILDIEALAKELRVNNTLEQLCLKECYLKTDSARLLANALKFNTTLWELNLSDNNIDEGGAECFIELINMNPTLQELNLKNNFCNDQLKTIKKLLIDNKKKNTSSWLGFLHAIEHGEKAPWNMAKLMIVGQGRAGKTATARSLLNEPFQETESTIGVELTQSKVAAKDADWKKHVGKPESFIDSAAARVATKQFHALNDKSSEAYKPKKKKKPKKKNNLPRKDNLIDDYIIDTTTKAKDTTTVVLLDKDEIAHRYNEELVSTADDALTFTIWDYGGQTVFYTLHHLFLTRYGVYLLVFDMREALGHQKECEDYLKFWLNSIDLHATDAPILMVGTFYDVVKDKMQLKKIGKVVEDIIGKFPQVVQDQEDKLPFFPLNNLTGECRNIRATLERVTREQEYVSQEVSLRWLHCLDLFLKDTSRSWYSLAESTAMAQEQGIMDPQEHENMLKLFHQLGVIIYFTATQDLRDIIVTNPQWLIDNIGQVIRDPVLHKRDPTKLKAAELEQDDEILFSKGLASRDLLNFLWKKQPVDFLLDLMRNALLLSDWKFGEGQRTEMFLIPSMVWEIEHLDPSTVHGLKCVFDFSQHYLPNGVFQRLVCLLVGHSASNMAAHEPKLCQSSASIYLKQCFIRLFKLPERIMIGLEPERESAVPKTLQLLLSSMHKLDVDAMGSGLIWDLILEMNNESIPYAEAKKQKKMPWFNQVVKASELSSRVMKNINLDAFLQM